MRDPEPLEQVGPVAPAGEAHVAGDGQVREQAVVLRQVADAASLGAEVDACARRRTRASSPSAIRPARRPLEPGDGAQQRRLAGAGRADERDRLGADAQRGAKIERSPREGDVDVEEVHERTSSLEAQQDRGADDDQQHADRDRLIEVGVEQGVDGQRQRLGGALEAAGEQDRRAELADPARERDRRRRAEPAAGQRDRDPQHPPQRARAERAGDVEQRRVDAPRRRRSRRAGRTGWRRTGSRSRPPPG